MNVPRDYDTARAYDGTSQQLPAGGYVCKILNATVTQSKTGKDMLVLCLDIDRGEYAGYFRKKYDAYKGNSAYSQQKPKWPAGGTFRICVTNNDGGTSGFFKGAIRSVEEANRPYVFADTNYNELTLVNKLIGINFGEEEYLGNEGDIKVAVKPFYAVSVAKVIAGEIVPPERKTYNGPQAAQTAAPQPSTDPGTFEETDDELPF